MMIDPVYSRDGIQIYHADCMEVLEQLQKNSVHLVLTDPPYGHNNNDGDLQHNIEAALGKGERGEARPILNDGEEANDLVLAMYAHARRVLKPGCCICCCCPGGGGSQPTFARWSNWLDDLMDFKQAVVWDKGGLGLGWHYHRTYEFVLVAQKPGASCHWFGGNDVSNIVRVPKIIPDADEHPTPKPIPLMQRFIGYHTEAGDVVLDPFMGAGTTLVAAKAMGRRAIGIELDERWIKLAVKRLSQTALPIETERPDTWEKQTLF